MRLLLAIACLFVGFILPALADTRGQGDLIYVAGSTKKVCQLTGDLDRERGQPTRSETGKRFGVTGTDLGSTFEHRGRLFFLFGDTGGRPGWRDAVAWTKSRDPAAILLDFYRDPDGKWLPPTVPGVRLGAFEVPSGGLSVRGRMYVVFTTDWSPTTYVMGRSVLAASDDDGKTWKALYDLSLTRFINVSFQMSDGWLYIFGSGRYRKSSAYVARVRPGEITDRSRIRYLGGIGPDGQPRWTTVEGEATPLFHDDVVGEFSVTYCKPVRRYVLLYNSPNPRGIVLRSATTPWGPWSPVSVVFDPWRDGGYGHFMHIPANFKADKSDSVEDPGRENEWGGEYGPYLISRFTTGRVGRCRIFYSMSTWNPYQVVVMQTDLALESTGAQSTIPSPTIADGSAPPPGGVRSRQR